MPSIEDSHDLAGCGTGSATTANESELHLPLWFICLFLFFLFSFLKWMCSSWSRSEKWVFHTSFIGDPYKILRSLYVSWMLQIWAIFLLNLFKNKMCPYVWDLISVMCLWLFLSLLYFFFWPCINLVWVVSSAMDLFLCMNLCCCIWIVVKLDIENDSYVLIRCSLYGSYEIHSCILNVSQNLNVSWMKLVKEYGKTMKICEHNVWISKRNLYIRRTISIFFRPFVRYCLLYLVFLNIFLISGMYWMIWWNFETEISLVESRKWNRLCSCEIVTELVKNIWKYRRRSVQRWEGATAHMLAWISNNLTAEIAPGALLPCGVVKSDEIMLSSHILPFFIRFETRWYYHFNCTVKTYFNSNISGQQQIKKHTEVSACFRKFSIFAHKKNSPIIIRAPTQL
jgi:hypothetical protein